MKTITDSKAVVNFKLVSLLLALSIVLHIVAEAISTSHPLLRACLTLLEFIGWISVLLIWVAVLIKGIPSWTTKLWTKAWTGICTYQHAKKAKENDTFVSVEELKSLRNNIQRLGLALHGMTPEMENARRQQFEMLGEAVPDPILPPQNAVLYAEFKSLIRFLNHFGFPNLESVQLQNKQFQFAWEWGSDLQARLHQAQKSYTYQQQTMEWMLGEADKKLEAINSEYQQVQDDAGYQRIQGALKLLKKMAPDSHCPEEVTSYLAALMQDMESLRKQLKQAVA